MVPIKCFLSIVLQLIIIEEFINANALGRNVVDTAFCPISFRETGGSTWLLHGIPQKCYVAGSQGPCDFNQVFLPRSQNSNHGQCLSLSQANIPKLNSGDIHQEITQKFVSYNRTKRQILNGIFSTDVPPDVPDRIPGQDCASCGITHHQPSCPKGTLWSTHRKRCMPKNIPCFIC